MRLGTVTKYHAPPAKFSKVFELHRAIRYLETWHFTGGMTGTLYRDLARAQAQIVGAGPWTKRERRNVWETEHHDLIIQRKVTV